MNNLPTKKEIANGLAIAAVLASKIESGNSFGGGTGRDIQIYKNEYQKVMQRLNN
ncbi:hypothetical protein [Lactobacillus intestinalis]|uniref:hypothetical protein n=1 Tax=Lactobacillus intestinalis TaxID=151781 RepID=UPI0025AA23CA|nr:hypothetical protein [Lactobacillus intestinalis]